MRLLLLLLCLALPLPALAQSDGQPSGTIEIEDSAETDAAIATRIREIMAQLEGYEDVTVTVSSGIVTLRGETAEAEQAARLAELVSRIAGVVAVENQIAETMVLTERLNPAVDRFQKRITQTISYLPLLAVAAAVFLVVQFLGYMIARARQPWDRLAPNPFIANIYRQLVFIVFGIAGLVIALDVLNATALLSTILGAAGIIGLAIGFAVRDTVENFIASIMLSIRQPFAPNDAVEINGDEGKVIRLTSRATILLSFDGNHIRIPNSTVFKSRIVNYSRNAERRFQFEVGVDAADTDLADLRRLAEDTVAALNFTLAEPAPSVWIDRIGDGSIVMQVTGWIDQRETSLLLAKGEAIRQVMAAIDTAGFEMPNTTYRIEMTGGAEAPASLPARGRARAGRSAPGPSEPLAEESVAAQDEALDKIVADERNDPTAPDLLDRSAPKE